MTNRGVGSVGASDRKHQSASDKDGGDAEHVPRRRTVTHGQCILSKPREKWSNPMSMLLYREVERGLGTERWATDYLLDHIAQPVQVSDFALEMSLKGRVVQRRSAGDENIHPMFVDLIRLSHRQLAWHDTGCRMPRASGQTGASEWPYAARPRAVGTVRRVPTPDPLRGSEGGRGNHERVSQTARYSGRAAVGRGHV